ncbi:MAG: S8 family serine peptidase [Acidobacteriota bacterium]
MNEVTGYSRKFVWFLASASLALAAFFAASVAAAAPDVPKPEAPDSDTLALETDWRVAAGKVAPALTSALGEAALSGALETTYRVQVTLRPSGALPMPKNLRMTADMLQTKRRVAEVQNRVFARRRGGSFKLLNRYRVIPGFSAVVDEAALRDLSQMPEVEQIELMPVYQKMDAESHPLANVDDLHAAGFTGKGVTIAIIDDGFDLDHPAFGGFSSFPNSKIVGGRDFADNDSDPDIDCNRQFHGTAVAGVAAGNGGGVLGTAPDAAIVALKVQSQSLGCEGDPSGSLDGDVGGAIDWAVANASTYGIRVISMSLGSFIGFSTVGSCESFDIATRNAINAAHSAGIPVIVASGNAGLCSAIALPSCMGNAISVGAVYDANLGVKGFCVSDLACNGQFNSNCQNILGSNTACFDTTTSADLVTCYTNSSSLLDVLAPSENALSAWPGGGTTSSFGGTSSATPFTSGVVAAMIEKDPTLDGDEVRAILTSTGVDIQDAKNGLFKPRVDALAAIDAVSDGVSVTLISSATEDGWVRESEQNSNVGGSNNSVGAGDRAIRIGDSGVDRQFKSILSFETSSIPAGATITQATVRIRRSGVWGGNPFTTFGGNLLVDVQSGGFSGSTALQNQDFQATATAPAAATMSSPASNGDWSEGVLDASGLAAINVNGRTQIRLAFEVGDNNSGSRDHIGFYSSNNSDPDNHPQLVITYQE